MHIRALVFIFFNIMYGFVNGQLTITEVMFDPATSEYHDEFIELYNLSQSDSVNIAGCMISDSAGTDRLLSHRGGEKIAPEAFAVILDGSYFENSETYDNIIPDSVLILKSEDNSIGSGGLSNSYAEQISILDSAGLIITSYRYSIDNKPGHSDEKIILNGDNVSENWGNSKIAGGTPGFKNSVSPVTIDPGFDESSILVPQNLYYGMPALFSFTIFNFGIDTPYDSIDVFVFLDQDFDYLYGPADKLIMQAKFQFLPAENHIVYDIRITDLKCGYHRICAQIYAREDKNNENNFAQAEFKVLHNDENLRINEIKFLAQDNEPEWLELINMGDNPIYLDGWAFCDIRDTARIDSGAYIHAGQYKIVCADTIPLEYQVPESLVIYTSEFPTLNNSEDEIRLIRPDGSWQEFVRYQDKWLEGNEIFKPSLERINPGLYANNSANWGPSVAPERATPGKKNSIYSMLDHPHQNISAKPDPFSPDNDGIDDVTLISGIIPDLSALIRVRIYDIKGRLIRTIAHSQFSGNRFDLVWDGRDDSGRIARIGIYIIHCQVINDREGILRNMKSTVVLAQRL